MTIKRPLTAKFAKKKPAKDAKKFELTHNPFSPSEFPHRFLNS